VGQYTASSSSVGIADRYDGSVWTSTDFASSQVAELSAVWGTGATNAVAAGYKRVGMDIKYVAVVYDGTKWGTPAELGSVYVMGDRGTILRRR